MIDKYLFIVEGEVMGQTSTNSYDEAKQLALFNLGKQPVQIVKVIETIENNDPFIWLDTFQKCLTFLEVNKQVSKNVKKFFGAISGSDKQALLICARAWQWMLKTKREEDDVITYVPEKLGGKFVITIVKYNYNHPFGFKNAHTALQFGITFQDLIK